MTGRGAGGRLAGDEHVARGRALTDALLDRLSGRDLDRHGTLVIPLATVDPAGWPHIALLSYSEVVARDRGALRLAIGGRSGSAANLRRTGHATVLLFDTGLVHYIKGKARERRPVDAVLALERRVRRHRDRRARRRVGSAPRGRVVRARRRDRSLRSVVGRRTYGGARRAPVRHATDDICHPPPPDRRHHRRQRHDLRHPPARAPARARRREPPDPEPLGRAHAAPRNELHGGAGAAARHRRPTRRPTRARPSRAGRSSRWA